MFGEGNRSRNLTIVPLTLSDTIQHTAKPIKEIVVFKAGTLKIEDIEGNVQTLTFPAAAEGGCYPCRIECMIRKVYDTDTDLTAADILALH